MLSLAALFQSFCYSALRGDTPRILSVMPKSMLPRKVEGALRVFLFSKVLSFSVPRWSGRLEEGATLVIWLLLHVW